VAGSFGHAGIQGDRTITLLNCKHSSINESQRHGNKLDQTPAGRLLSTFIFTFILAWPRRSHAAGRTRAHDETLTQVEPRTPILVAFSITQSGSYYVTTNLYVASGRWHLHFRRQCDGDDLNGFALTGGEAPARFTFSQSWGSEPTSPFGMGSLSGGVRRVASTGSHNFVWSTGCFGLCKLWIGSVVCPIFARDCISDYNGTLWHLCL